MLAGVGSGVKGKGLFALLCWLKFSIGLVAMDLVREANEQGGRPMSHSPGGPEAIARASVLHINAAMRSACMICGADRRWNKSEANDSAT